MSTDDEKKYASLLPLLSKKGPFSGESMPDEGLLEHLAEQKILVIGAGGLGCEILKNLALSGFKDIHVIDLDTIDVSNLNRQFLFRKADIGKPKSKVAADFINKRCKGVKVESYQGKIQDYPPEWYKEFDFIIAGLDNIEARRWINKTLVDFVQYLPDGTVDWDTVKPLVDGGTEGFSGQARLILPGFTSCFECSVKSLPPERAHFHLCTIANVPRIPEHCIMFALQIQWPLLTSFKSVTEYTMTESRDEKKDDKPSVSLDKDDVNHMTWLFNRSEERAKKFNIVGVTYNLTMQVVKNIIPAIASTNALIAAECVNEVFKYLTFCAPRVDNFFLFMGAVGTGINTETYKYGRLADCDVCKPPHKLTVKLENTLHDIFDLLAKQLKFTEIKAASAGDKLMYLKHKHDDYAENMKYPPKFLDVTDNTTWIFTDKSKGTEKVIISWGEESASAMEHGEEQEDDTEMGKDD